MCPIPETYSPENSLDMFFTGSVPIISSFTDPIKSPTIPFPHSNFTLILTLSDSISRPQEPSSNLPKDQFISIPCQLLFP